jgi:DnaJ-class molecular chaperone
VGLLHEELDALELALAEAELGIIKERIGGKVDAPLDPEARLEAQPRFTTDAIRRLFRDVAKAIHPDLAQDELARDRRHALMIEANRAYEIGDEEQLRAILDRWERSPEAVEGADEAAMRLRLLRRIAQMEEQIDSLDASLAAVKDTSLWKLKAMVDEEAARGKDLIQDMVKRLKRDILVATNRLEAIKGIR